MYGYTWYTDVKYVKYMFYIILNSSFCTNLKIPDKSSGLYSARLYILTLLHIEDEDCKRWAQVCCQSRDNTMLRS